MNIKAEIISDLVKTAKLKDEIIRSDITRESIESFQKGHREFEIESPLTGETDAEWVRINYNGIYIYIHLDNDNKANGNLWYQLDYIGSYGLELIWTDSITEFMKQLMELTETEIMETIF